MQISERRTMCDRQRESARHLIEICNTLEGLEAPLNLAPADSGEAGPRFIVASEDEGIVGLLSLEEMRDIEISLVVHPDHRRRGIGRSLLAAAVDGCRRRGAASCLLVCDEASAAGRAFALAMCGQYRYSEHRLDLDRKALPSLPLDLGRLQLIPVTPGSIETFARISAESFGHPVDREIERRVQDFKLTGRWYYLAMLEQEPIGTVRVMDCEDGVYITSLAVLPEFRGRGYGRQILMNTVQRLVPGEERDIRLEVETRNENALTLYTSCGFRMARTYGYYGLEW